MKQLQISIEDLFSEFSGRTDRKIYGISVGDRKNYTDSDEAIMYTLGNLSQYCTIIQSLSDDNFILKLSGSSTGKYNIYIQGQNEPYLINQGSTIDLEDYSDDLFGLNIEVSCSGNVFYMESSRVSAGQYPKKEYHCIVDTPLSQDNEDFIIECHERDSLTYRFNVYIGDSETPLESRTFTSPINFKSYISQYGEDILGEEIFITCAETSRYYESEKVSAGIVERIEQTCTIIGEFSDECCEITASGSKTNKYNLYGNDELIATFDDGTINVYELIPDYYGTEVYITCAGNTYYEESERVACGTISKLVQTCTVDGELGVGTWSITASGSHNGYALYSVDDELISEYEDGNIDVDDYLDDYDGTEVYIIAKGNDYYKDSEPVECGIIEKYTQTCVVVTSISSSNLVLKVSGSQTGSYNLYDKDEELLDTYSTTQINVTQYLEEHDGEQAFVSCSGNHYYRESTLVLAGTISKLPQVITVTRALSDTNYEIRCSGSVTGYYDLYDSEYNLVAENLYSRIDVREYKEIIRWNDTYIRAKGDATHSASEFVSSGHLKHTPTPVIDYTQGYSMFEWGGYGMAYAYVIRFMNSDMELVHQEELSASRVIIELTDYSEYLDLDTYITIQTLVQNQPNSDISQPAHFTGFNQTCSVTTQLSGRDYTIVASGSKSGKYNLYDDEYNLVASNLTSPIDVRPYKEIIKWNDTYLTCSPSGLYLESGYASSGCYDFVSTPTFGEYIMGYDHITWNGTGESFNIIIKDEDNNVLVNETLSGEDATYRRFSLLPYSDILPESSYATVQGINTNIPNSEVSEPLNIVREKPIVTAEQGEGDSMFKTHINVTGVPGGYEYKFYSNGQLIQLSGLNPFDFSDTYLYGNDIYVQIEPYSFGYMKSDMTYCATYPTDYFYIQPESNTQIGFTEYYQELEQPLQSGEYSYDKNTWYTFYGNNKVSANANQKVYFRNFKGIVHGDYFHHGANVWLTPDTNRVRYNVGGSTQFIWNSYSSMGDFRGELIPRITFEGTQVVNASMLNFNTNFKNKWFKNCIYLNSLPLNINVSSEMFYGCTSLTTVTINNYSIETFRGCSNLTTFNTSDSSIVAHSGERMFYECNRLTNIPRTIILGNGQHPDYQQSRFDEMFRGCSSLSGSITLQLVDNKIHYDDNFSFSVNSMFSGTNINDITLLVDDIELEDGYTVEDVFDMFLDGATSTGTLRLSRNRTFTFPSSCLPSGWTIVEV